MLAYPATVGQGAFVEAAPVTEVDVFQTELVHGPGATKAAGQVARVPFGRFAIDGQADLTREVAQVAKRSTRGQRNLALEKRSGRSSETVSDEPARLFNDAESDAEASQAPTGPEPAEVANQTQVRRDGRRTWHRRG